MDIDKVVDERIDNDTEFQNSIVDFSEEDKQTAINEKRAEVIKNEFESLSKVAKENEQKFKDQQARAKKAEDELGKVKPEKKDGLSDQDVIYLARQTEVHDDDMGDLRKHMEKYQVSAKEAHDYLKPIFKERNEERKTAEATNIKGSSRGAFKPSLTEVLNQAEQGKVPESDEDIAKLAEARMARKVAEAGQK